MDNRLFICNIVPNELITELNAPQAANNFCSSLINGKCFNKCFSIVPPSYYHEKIVNDNGIWYFFSKHKINRLANILKLLYHNIKVSILAKKYKNIWFYNICKSNILCYLILRFLLKKNVYIILLDYTPSSKFYSVLKYIPFLYRKSNGVISLSMRSEITHSNILYKAGIIPHSEVKINPSVISNEKLTFLFSGNLDSHTGFPMALDVFKELTNYELYISGNGKIDPTLLQQYPNIHYMGYLSYENYIKLYSKVDICLSFRNPNYPENSNNFPSKIIEYFHYNKIVLSTIDYPEIESFLYFKCRYEKSSIIDKIKEINSLTISQLEEYMNNTTNLDTHFSEKSWQKAFNTIEKAHT